MFQRGSHYEYTVQQPFSWLKKAILMVAVSGFIAVVWYAAANRDNLSSEDLNPTLVQAPQSPIKERPKSPGGMDVPHREKKVFNLLEQDAEEESKEDSDKIDESGLKNAVQPKSTKTVQPGGQDKKSSDTQDKPTKNQPSQAKDVKPKAEPETAGKSGAADVATDVRQSSEPTPKPDPAPEPHVDTRIGWAVQLGSFRSRKDAKKAINIFNKKFETMLEGLTPAIRTAQLDQGTYHRVSYVGLESGEAAKNLCSAFKQRNQGCLHVNLK